jgi:transcriptional regulator with XRE-family HTH domain
MALKAVNQLRQNIEALLLARKEDQKTLAFAMGVHPTTVNKFLRGTRELQLADLDKVADFFGIATYQLFQPGISLLTERRLRTDRRTGRDRRIGHAQRQMLGLNSALEPFRSPSGKARHAESSFVVEARRLADEYERKLTALVARAESGGQTPTPRPHFPKASKGRRTAGGSDPETPREG